MRKIAALLAVALAMIALLPMSFATLSGESPIPTPPNFYIGSNMTSLCSGRVTYVPITITNQKTAGLPDMENLVLTLVNSQMISEWSNGTINAGTVVSNSSKTVYLPVLVSKNATGYVRMELGINYYFHTLYTDTETRNLTFAVYKCSSPLSISVSPSIVPSGSVQNVTLNLTDTGNTTLSAVSLRLTTGKNLSSSIVIMDQPNFVDAIAPGNSIKINASIYMSTSEIVPFNVSGSFYNGTRFYLEDEHYYLKSGGLIALSSSSLTISPSSPTSGGAFSASFVITNRGTTTATAATATAYPSNGISAFSTNSVYIGDISSDSQSTVTLSFTVANTVAKGTYAIPVKITYLDGLRNNESSWANVTVNVTKSSTSYTAVRTASNSSSNSYLIPEVGVAAVVIAGGAFLFIRRRNMKAAEEMEGAREKSERQGRKE